MAAADSETTAALAPARPSWVVGPARPDAARRLARGLRHHGWLVPLCAALAVLGGLAYLASADEVYEARAELLVTPLPSTAPVLVPGLVYGSRSPARDTGTIARLARGGAVTRRVQRELGIAGKEVAARVRVEPVGDTHLVHVIAEGSTPRAAQRLADAYAVAVVAVRAARSRAAVRERLASLPPIEGEADEAEASARARARIFLRGLLRGSDPTLRLEAGAALPKERVRPQSGPILGAAAGVGALLGLLAALLLGLVDNRLRQEEDLRQRFRLPVLARIPRERRRRPRPLLPQELSLAALDAFEALARTLAAPPGRPPADRQVLVTGPSTADGRTTASINLASTLAAAGRRTALIEADSVRPALAEALSIDPEHGIASVISGRAFLVDALAPVGGERTGLVALVTRPDEPPATDLLSPLAADTLLLQARQLTDWVVIDAPPLHEFAEAVTLAELVDTIVIVVRLGKSRLRELDALAQVLARQGIEPAGFVLIGGRQPRQTYY